jgi:hypothetical protein
MLMHQKWIQWFKNYLFGCFPTQIIAFVVIEFSYLRFSCHFRRGLKVRLFLLATMAPLKERD